MSVGRHAWALLPALVLLTLAIYAPAWHGGVLWDDDAHLTKPALQSVDGLRRIWSDVDVTQQYYPVTHTAFWVMNRLWGQATFGYHLANILLHGLNAFLFGLILRRLAVPGAWIAALLFVVHPVHVESVAWMTEMKNTLSGAFYLSAMLAYLRFDSSRRAGTYAVALALFVLALLSKSVTATLPAAVLVILWWQRGKLDWRRDVAPLAPFFVLGIAGGLLTAWVERTVIGAEGTEFQLSILERVLIAGRAIWFYLGTIVWPSGLTFIYPRWHLNPSAWWQYLYPASALALLAAAWLWRGRSRAPLAALLLFAGTLFPALGFINVYPFRYSFVADHFQYLASIAILAPIAALIVRFAGRSRHATAIATAVALVVAVPLSAISWRQAHQYVDAETLYRTTIDRNPECWLAYTNLAVRELDRGDQGLASAISHLQTALRLNADNAEAHNSLGLAWQRLGRLDDAMIEHREALRLQPGFADAAYNIGYDLQLGGRSAEAVTAYEHCLTLDATYVKAHNNLANVLGALGRTNDAIAHFHEALRIDPSAPEVHQNLGTVLHRSGRLDEAVAEYKETLRLQPDLGEVHNNLATALRQLGRRDEALAEFRESVRLLPASVQARRFFGEALLTMELPGEAVTQLREALTLAGPQGSAELHNDLGLALAGIGRRDDAIAEFKEALRLKPDSVAARSNLARVQAMPRIGR